MIMIWNPTFKKCRDFTWNLYHRISVEALPVEAPVDAPVY
jgi:hypothetical protein